MKALRYATAARPGFSLMEMLVVIAVLSLLMMMAVPALFTMIPRYQVQSSARGVAEMMQAARLHANNSQKPVRLVVNCKTSPCVAEYSTGVYNTAGQLDPAYTNSRGVQAPWEEVTGSRRTLPPRIRIAPAEASPTIEPGSPANVYWAVFQPSGKAATSHNPMRLAVSSGSAFMGNYQYRVSLSNITSRVRLERGE
jgi:prepilin-type N-terminal cleavage/methylation domain-containing protein